MRESNYGKRPPMSKRTKKMLAGMIGAGVMVAVIVFFSYYKVDTVEVRGVSDYTDEEVKNMRFGDRWLPIGLALNCLQHYKYRGHCICRCI